jgi:hypothetical protein
MRNIMFQRDFFFFDPSFKSSNQIFLICIYTLAFLQEWFVPQAASSPQESTCSLPPSSSLPITDAEPSAIVSEEEVWDGKTVVFYNSRFQDGQWCLAQIQERSSPQPLPKSTEEELDCNLENAMNDTKFPIDLETEYDLTIKLKREAAHLWLEVDDLIKDTDLSIPGKLFFGTRNFPFWWNRRQSHLEVRFSPIKKTLL